jgi:hypothetical protein
LLKSGSGYVGRDKARRFLRELERAAYLSASERFGYCDANVVPSSLEMGSMIQVSSNRIRVELDAEFSGESLEWYSTLARSNREHLERKSRDEVYGKIKGRGTVAASSRYLHMDFCSTSKIATLLSRFASY